MTITPEELEQAADRAGASQSASWENLFRRAAARIRESEPADTKALILAKREGFVKGVQTTHQSFAPVPQWLKDDAAKAFPLPKVTRRREVPFNDCVYRANADCTGWEFRTLGGEWVPSRYVRAEAVTLLALLDNPDEEVGDGGL